jgi:phenylacetate-CoA ligase
MAPSGNLYHPEAQAMPRDELRAHQDQLLAAFAQRIFDQPIPFFRRKLESAGIAPGDIRGVDDLHRVPLTTKEELRAAEREHPPFGDFRGAPADKQIRLGTSGGTTGVPTTVLWTANDIEIDVETGCRMMWRMGMRGGVVATHCHPLGIYGGGGFNTQILERLGCLTVATNMPDTDEQIQKILDIWVKVKPQIYQLFPNVAAKMFEEARKRGIDPASINLRPPNENPKFQHLSGSAGIECMPYLATACQNFDGAHVCDDHAIVQAVDPATGRDVSDGARGHLVVTTITKDNGLLRYDMEDLVRVDHSLCSCGETSMRMWWDGRIKDITKVDGRDVLPLDVWGELYAYPELFDPAIEYQIVRDGDSSRLRLRLEAAAAESGDGAALTSRIEQGMGSALGVRVKVELLPRGALPRPAFKPERVVDE